MRLKPEITWLGMLFLIHMVCLAASIRPRYSASVTMAILVCGKLLHTWLDFAKADAERRVLKAGGSMAQAAFERGQLGPWRELLFMFTIGIYSFMSAGNQVFLTKVASTFVWLIVHGVSWRAESVADAALFGKASRGAALIRSVDSFLDLPAAWVLLESA